MSRSTSLFEDAVDVPRWLEADRSRPLRERLERDRAIGQRGPRDEPPLARVRRWWAELGDAEFGDSDLNSAREFGDSDPNSANSGLHASSAERAERSGSRLARARRFASLVVFVLGILAGAGVAGIAFRYDGSYPVNVLRVLGLLVAPQLVLLVLTLFLMPGRAPGLRWLQDALAAINPGMIAAGLYRQLTRSEPAATAFDWSTARSAAARRFGKWQMLCWSQLAAVGFNVAALATAVALIAFTDLAFGWSTTLGLGADTVTQIARTLSWPWQALFPAAVPDLALVERSQFFRLDGTQAFDGDASRVLAGWWPFVLLAIGVYGLGLRLVVWLFVTRRLTVATQRWLLDDPGVSALLDRMSAPVVETAPGTAEAAAIDDGAVALARAPALVGHIGAIVWRAFVSNDAVGELARRKLGVDLARVETAGVESLDADARACRRIADDRPAAVAIFVPAWEPPLLDFSDFLIRLREAVGPHASLVVVPCAEAIASAADTSPAAPASIPATPQATPNALQVKNWERAVARAGDPSAYVEIGA